MSSRRESTIRNLLCLLPDGHIRVDYWMPHPCGGYYVIDAAIMGPAGYVGRAVDQKAGTP